MRANIFPFVRPAPADLIDIQIVVPSGKRPVSVRLTVRIGIGCFGMAHLNPSRTLATPSHWVESDLQEPKIRQHRPDEGFENPVVVTPLPPVRLKVLLSFLVSVALGGDI